MTIRNMTPYPDDLVRELVRFGMAESLDGDRAKGRAAVHVNVKRHRSQREAAFGMFYDGVPSVSNAPPHARYLITVRVAYAERFPLPWIEHDGRPARSRMRGVVCADWHEALVAIAAHEGRHLFQTREGLRGRGELDADGHAWRRLAEYRRWRIPASLRWALALANVDGSEDDPTTMTTTTTGPGATEPRAHAAQGENGVRPRIGRNRRPAERRENEMARAATATDNPAAETDEAAAGPTSDELLKGLVAEVKSKVKGVEVKSNPKVGYTAFRSGGKVIGYAWTTKKSLVRVEVALKISDVPKEARKSFEACKRSAAIQTQTRVTGDSGFTQAIEALKLAAAARATAVETKGKDDEGTQA